ncbi:MAG TPA: 3-isopropylmalate dehydratase small subunit [Acidimicrobiia bacterium]|jgi:3-isopropylmalate/(R)-2-methylmalate dehydratase small subunit|nr:3-isopropylmalate dehydratase small subunit [Acidimicrobiia bacterium]
MKAISTISGRLAPLPRANVDTDQIMPKRYLKRVERTGYGQYVFAEWREADPNFVLNLAQYRGARILVTGPNFGCGSSREHAPWGLQDWGFEAIVAPSFADIFFNNCTKIGLLPVLLSEKEVAWLMELAQADPEALVEVSLRDQKVTTDGFEADFALDPYTRWRLENGLDDIELTLRHTEDIDGFEALRSPHFPSLK